MQRLYPQKATFLIFVIPVLLLAYQNCGQITPLHEGSGTLLSVDDDRRGGIGDGNIPGGNDVDPSFDINILALRPAATEVWQSQCNSCHTNRRVRNLDNLQTEIFSGLLFNHSSNAGKWTVNQTGRAAAYSMPTGGATLSTDQLSALNNWISAIKAKKDAVESDISSCQSKTSFRYTDIQALLRQSNISYNGKTESCQSCHGNGSSLGVINTYAQVTALAIPRQPSASILIDALRPGTGSSPEAYHNAPDSTVNTLANWIEGCMPQ